jgi:DNA-binding LacI/PurR family transcriptional regulator
VVTIKDVASKAGVTAATVSNVIRNKGLVAKATEQRVLEAIKELGYRPNLAARGLVQRRGVNLAMLLPNIANPFYPEIALEAEQQARAAGYQFLLCNTHYDPVVSQDYLERLAGGLVGGVIAMEGGIKLEDLEEIARRGVPVVRCLWAELLEHEGRQSVLPGVDFDFERAGELAAEHLLSLGHRDFWAIIARATLDNPGHLYRLRGFRRGLAKAGLTLPDHRVHFGDTTIESGRQAFEAFLESAERPTALFASNDMMALGAMEAALDAGLRIPDDLSTVGLDDIAMSRHVRPALTTVAVPKLELARRATDLLLGQIENPQRSPNVILLQPEVVARQSTAPANPQARRTRGGLS